MALWRVVGGHPAEAGRHSDYYERDTDEAATGPFIPVTALEMAKHKAEQANQDKALSSPQTKRIAWLTMSFRSRPAPESADPIRAFQLSASILNLRASPAP